MIWLLCKSRFQRSYYFWSSLKKCSETIMEICCQLIITITSSHKSKSPFKRACNIHFSISQLKPDMENIAKWLLSFIQNSHWILNLHNFTNSVSWFKTMVIVIDVVIGGFSRGLKMISSCTGRLQVSHYNFED